MQIWLHRAGVQGETTQIGLGHGLPMSARSGRTRGSLCAPSTPGGSGPWFLLPGMPSLPDRISQDTYHWGPSGGSKEASLMPFNHLESKPFPTQNAFSPPKKSREK